MKGNISRWMSVRRWSCRLMLAAIAVVAMACAAWNIAIRVMPDAPAVSFPRPATFLQDRNGTPLAAFVGQADAWFIPLKSEELSENLKKAIVAVEDRRFFSHGGVDWHSVAGAAFDDLLSLRIKRGASTITMQLVRLRNPRHRSWSAKLEQSLRAEQLERREDKQAILTEYLNRAPFGGNLVGAGAASWRYFGKSCKDLSLGEAALLAGLPQNPNRFRPDRHPEAAKLRRQHVLDEMLATGAITPAEYKIASAEPVSARWRPLPQDDTHHVWGSIAPLSALLQQHLGETLRTSLDARIQQEVFQVANEYWNTLSPSGIDSAAVVVAEVHTGQVLATVSLSRSTAAVDLTRTPRSTGSVLKPFIYASAFQMGLISPDAEITDSSKSWAGYVPSDFDRQFEGKIPVGDALAESRNIPAMMLLARTGIERSLGVMEAAGIRTPASSARTYGLSLAIGGGEASPLEVAEGYATLARGGRHLPLTMVPSPGNRSLRVLSERACSETLQCISSPGRTDAIPGAHQAALLHAAWKTGTSNGYRDAWCAAATPSSVVVVWLGNSSGRGSGALVGQDVAAPLALRLIGKISPPGQWPHTEAAPVSRIPPVRTDAARLSIVTPRASSHLLLQNPTDRVPLTAAGGAGARRWWFANGTPVGESAGSQPAWWLPTDGNYKLRVVDETGIAAEIQVEVVEAGR